MSIKVALEHRSTYEFERPVNVGPHVVRLRPAPHTRTPIEAYSLTVQPDSHFLNWQQDPFGNWLARLVFPEPVRTLDITVGLVADMVAVNPFDFFIEEYAQRFPFSYDEQLREDLAPYLRAVSESAGSGPGPIVTAWREKLPELPADGEETIPFLQQLNAAIHRDVAYSVRMEPGVQTPDETLQRAIGSCRDSAWLLVSVLRQFGLAARFVSGYLVQLSADQEAVDGAPNGPAQDFTDLHAWAEVYLPGAGWVGMDPTSALFASEGHIPLSATPHPSSSAAISGATDPVGVEFSFSNTVQRIEEPPRVTKPYPNATWLQIDALGQAVDERLEAADVRLTQGGEPTFVSVDDMSGEEWNTAADGDDKRRLADELAARLRATYAAGGVVHRGQGKWYPGEPVPRWQIALQWRTDGEPLWHKPELLDNPWQPGRGDTSTAAEALARRFVEALGLPDSQLREAYEDPLLARAEELRQPSGPRPPELLADTTNGPRPISVSEVAKLDSDAGIVAGWVVPLVPGEQWLSPDWQFRRGRLVLTPGTSPIGLRLPLDAINWTDPVAPIEPSYLTAGPPLDPALQPIDVVPPDELPTTAVAIEGRDGHVFVFLPPTERLEDYITLLRVVETAASGLSQPVVLEGYGPPPDPRLTQLVVTPDPGVIEVNVQPTRSWDELRELTVDLYETARQTRLSTEKFDHDGTHTGTGGGNHITFGGIEPADSPLLRRPDVLASMVAFWQRHPSLSYLFSGRFVGPTSQAPRFDEGRPEAVYEAEIALSEIRRITAEGAARGDEPPLWLSDRALRHILTDLTGNTHRAEFCIDKLYNPDTSRGRLGILELRGFEMPPHPQMAMVQSLLVRSLVAYFWDRPYDQPLIRWDTRLHEDFLIAHGVIADIEAVVRELQDFGIAFDPAWLDPFTEFRFPRLGRTDVGGVELELRQGIEPWNVLGEEASSGGTARYVDSSIERLQVRAVGLDPSRLLVTCNGVAVPLASTKEPDEYVAGVRYRAWQPPSALHPTIDVHAPLRFDVIDTNSARSLGGATYHVVHPGGRAHDSPPVNAREAEGRRNSRFEPFGHTSGEIDLAAIRSTARRCNNGDYQHTLDLRQVVRTRPNR